MKVRDVIRKLREDGWTLVRTRGSHRVFKHRSKPGSVTLAGHPGDEVKPGTLGSILRQADLQVRVQAMKYAVVIEKAPKNYSAYVPDVPGCIATWPL